MVFDSHSHKNIGCDQSTIAIVIILKCKTGDIDRRAISGLNRRTTKPEDRYLKGMCLLNRHASAPYLKARFQGACGVNIRARN